MLQAACVLISIPFADSTTKQWFSPWFGFGFGGFGFVTVFLVQGFDGFGDFGGVAVFEFDFGLYRGTATGF
jgi:hypothetical protein